jgi:DNA relaxase NicK
VNKPHWLEVGTRGVGLYIRIYDKEAESKGDPAYDGVWRVEAEIAKDKANEAFHWLISRRFAVVAIRECGTAHLAQRGIRLAGERYSKWYIVPMDARPDTDTERTLGWLRKLVRPAIARLLKHTDRSVIIDALGLWPSETED